MTVTPRLMMNPDEIVLTKTGKDATNPALADEDKIFDSKWLFGNQILAQGKFVDVSSHQFIMQEFAYITLPDFGFQPAVIFRNNGQANNSDSYFIPHTPRSSSVPEYSPSYPRGYRNTSLIMKLSPTGTDYPQFTNNYTVRIKRYYHSATYGWMGLDTIYWTAFSI